MGDALSGVFGSGGNTSTDNTIDPTSQQLNQMRQQQIAALFAGSPVSKFGADRPDIYTSSPAVNNLFSNANAPPDLGNLISIQDYVDMALNEGKNYISKVATPEIMQSAALQGLEGGGYVPEAIGKATASIAPGFLNSLPGASTALTLAGPQASLLGSQKAQTLFPLADQSRALSEQDLLRQQGLSVTGLTGLPYTPVTDSNQKKSSQPLFNFFGQG